MKKMLCSVVVFIAMSTASASAFQLLLPSFQAGDWLEQKFSLVHFTLPDVATNNFQGAFFWLPVAEVPGALEPTAAGGGMPISWSSYPTSTKYCTKQLRGLYYNNARGSRLWPLDTQTKNGLNALDINGTYTYNDLVLNGGFYTTCGLTGSVDLRSIYGQISFTGTVAYPGDYGSINAGFMYDPATNSIVGSTQGFYPTLQYFNNTTPIGFIFDTQGGIGFVGGQMESSGLNAVINEIGNNSGSINGVFGYTGNINNIQATTSSGVFSLITSLGGALDTFGNIGVLGNVLFGRGGLDVTNRLSMLGHPLNSSVVVFSDVTNTSDVLNELRKNASNICKGSTWRDESMNGTMPWNNNNGNINAAQLAGRRVLCIASEAADHISYTSASTPVIIDLSTPAEYNGVDIVVRGRNVILMGSVPNTSYALNLFVDNGNVLLKNDDFTTHVVNAGGADETFLTFDAQGEIIKVQAAGTIAGIPVGGAQTTPQIYDATLAANATGAVNYGKFLRGNIFVNGIIAGADGSNMPSSTVNKYYMQGKLTSLNTVLEPSHPRKQLITNIFGNDAGIYEPYIDFSKVFLRSCEVNGREKTNGARPCQLAYDMFKGKSFVLSSSYIPTRLYK